MLKRLIFNRRGSIGIALVVAMLGFISGISLVSVAIVDTRGARLNFDQVQQLHFIRSEISRSRILLSLLEMEGEAPSFLNLPPRTSRVETGRHRTDYSMRTKIQRTGGTSVGGEYKIETQTEASRGRGSTGNQGEISPIKKLSEVMLGSPESLATMHYFSDIEQPYYGDFPGEIRFFGGDIIYGPVHSNDDIWIRNLPSWPQFHGLVTTSGVVRVYPGGHTNFPEDQIFFGGLIENYPRIKFEPNAQAIRDNGTWLGSHSDSNIMFVTIEGSTFNAMLGEVYDTGIYDQYIIYNSYPPYGPIGDSIGVNNIARIDTLWTQAGSGSVNNSSIFVPMQLWISGDVGGRQTWGSSHDIYLKDNIKLMGTPLGLAPDDIDTTDPDFDPANPILGPNHNRDDYFGLVSEQSIYIQYGYWCPIDMTRKRPNTNNIYIYAAMAATGQGTGHQSWLDDGIFSFQYHFPKGATVDVYWQGELMTNIDLHLNKYPTSPINPWPTGLDYPWYNPLWPEPGMVYNVPSPPYPAPGFNTASYAPPGTPQLVKLRGTIFLFGSIAQRRRGFVRRSGNADEDTGVWDIPNLKFGHPVPSQGIGPSGYDKAYAFDYRFVLIEAPPDYPAKVFERDTGDMDEIVDLGFRTVSWKFRRPIQNF